MSRRELLKLGMAAGAATALAPAFGAQALPAPNKPNILFLMTDQQRGDCVGAAGNPAIHTPNLDRIAREGALFRNAYTCTPSCTPARTALLTGLAPWRNGMLGYGRVGEGYAIEMPSALRDAGYYTTGIGKMHWHPQRVLHGFHRTILDESSRAEHIDFLSDYRAWLFTKDPNCNPDVTGLTFNDFRSRVYALPEDYHPTYWTGETARHFIDTYDRPEPFFLKVSFARPHSPYDPPKRFMDMYAGADLPKAAVGDWEERYVPRSDDSPNIWHGDMGAEQVRQSRQGYYGSISFVDEKIGEILAALEKRGMLDNTLILFTSDHGDMLGDHHLWRKSYAYEGSANIPMIVRWPKDTLSEARGRVLDHPVEIRDILPTFMEAAGAPGAETLDGKSMLPIIVDEKAPWREFIDLEHDRCYDPLNHWTAVTDGHSKFIFHCETGEEQFFDLDADPGETVNRAADPAYAQRVQQWRQHMIDHLAPRGEPFVKDGKLAVRQASYLYSESYPGCKCHGKEPKLNDRRS
ncbi:MAG: arylsulfatase [Candidatus Hydrogenedentes bacterium]|nr:arylsulfatase [Candidatus Hydrogenedentota bacterium]